MKNKLLRILASYLCVLSLFINTSIPFLSVQVAYAEEATPSAEVSIPPTPEPTITPDLTPAPEATPTATPAPVVSDWKDNGDDSFQTIDDVVIDKEYVATQNDKVKIKFNQLPSPSGKISVKEVKLTPEQIQQTGALSDTAYDISSTMENGTFEYTLTLPAPKTDNIEVKASEDGNSFFTLGGVTTQADIVTITGLNHFTLFVLVNNIDNGGTSATTDDVANGVITTIKDAWINQSSPIQNNGNDTSLQVRSQNSSRDQRSIVQFDVSSVDSTSSIDKATLRLFMTSAPSSSRTYEIYRITSDWVEGNGNTNNNPVGEISWDNLNGTRTPTLTFASSPTSTTVVPTGTSNTWIEFDVTADVAAFLAGTPNYGWIIKDASESESATARTGTFKSRENATDNERPQLVVDFAKSGDQPTQYNSPTAQQADITAGDGNGFELNPTNAFSDGGGFASNINGAGDRHIFYNYGFNIPKGAKINGIETRADWFLDSISGINSLSVDLSSNGTDWTAAKTDSTETIDEHTVSFGGATDTWGRTWKAEDFNDGNFRVRVTSNSDNSARDFFLDWIPVRVYYTPDTTPPIVSADNSSDSWRSSNLDISLTASDGESGLNNVRYNWDSPATASAGTIYTDGTTINIPSEGSHTLYLYADDVAGNSSTFSGIYNLDTSDPIVSATGSSSDWQNSLPAIIVSANDSVSGVSSVQYAWDVDALGGAITSDGADLSSTFPGDGDHTLNLLVTDNAGRTNTFSGSYKIDRINPTDPGTPTTTTPTNNQTPTWTWDSSTDTNLDHYLFFWDTILGGETNNSGTITNNFFTIPGLTPLNLDGNWYGKVKAFDIANNFSTSNNGSALIDTVAPSIPSASPSAGDYQTAQSVTLSSNDDGSGVAGIYYTSDGSDPADVSNSARTLFTGTAITVDKDMTIKAVSYDNAGNVSAVMSETYGIAPVISGETVSTGTTTETSTTITWTTDNPATSRVIYDTVSHIGLGAAPNYGYANSTIEADNSLKVTSHSVNISGLIAGTTYYYRTVSHGSPESVSSEHTIATNSKLSSSSDSSGGTGDGLSDGLGCANHDCSTPALFTQAAQTQTTDTAVSGIKEGVLGTTTEEKTTSLGSNSQTELSSTPTPTGEVKGISATASNYWWLLFFGAGGLVVIFWFFKRGSSSD